MSTRKPPPRRAPTRRPPPPSPRERANRSSSSLPWAVIIGGVCLIAGGIIAWPRIRNTARPTPDAVATSVASTVQAMATVSGIVAPTPASTTAATAVLPSPTPSSAVAPTTSPATHITTQRDEDVDPVTGIAAWTEPAAGSEIRVMLRRADGTPLNEYVQAHRQGSDVSGNPVAEGRRVFGEWTGEDGIVTEGVAPGAYIIDFDADGWPWTEQFANLVVAAGQRTSVLFDLGLLTVGLRYADGIPANEYVSVFLQETNVSGVPVEGDKAASEWTSDDGLVTFELTPGAYALTISDIKGYDDWGRFNHDLSGGGTYTVILTLGRLVVETWNPDGTLATDVYVRVYTLDTDSTGSSVFGDAVDDEWSGNTGQAIFDLTPGLYGIEIDGEIQMLDVPVQSEQVTVVNQTGYTIP